MDILAPYKNVVYVNSGSRSSGSSNNFTIDLHSQIASPNPYDSVVLTSATIPKSFYLIDTTNNTFILEEKSVPTTITIATGNYNYTTLATALALALTTSSPNSYTYTVATSQLLGNYVFSVSGNAGSQPQLDFRNSLTCFIIGFNQLLYNFSASALTSPNVVNLQLTSTVQVLSDIVGGKDNVLSEITNQSASYSVITYSEQNSAYVSKPLSSNGYTSVHFWLIDEQQNLLNLNGLDWQMVIVVYKLDTYHNQMITDKRLELLQEHIE